MTDENATFELSRYRTRCLLHDFINEIHLQILDWYLGLDLIFFFEIEINRTGRSGSRVERREERGGISYRSTSMASPRDGKQGHREGTK